jgi:predicted transposase YdaD
MEFQKLTKHLHILTGLRKLQKIYQLTIKDMNNKFEFDFSDDPFYIEGIEIGEKRGEVKGIEKGKEIGKEIGIELGEDKKATLIAEKMLIDGKLPIKRIADFIDETETFVMAIQQRLVVEGKLVLKTKAGKVKTA